MHIPGTNQHIGETQVTLRKFGTGGAFSSVEKKKQPSVEKIQTPPQSPRSSISTLTAQSYDSSLSITDISFCDLTIQNPSSLPIKQDRLELPIKSASECLTFFKEAILSQSYQNAFLKEDLDHITKLLRAQFDFTEQQSKRIRESIKRLKEDEKTNPIAKSSNSVYFANKIALLNALYFIQEKEGFELLPSVKNRSLMPHFERRERVNFNIAGTTRAKPIVTVGKKTYALINYFDSEVREFGHGSFGRVRMAVSTGSSPQKLFANKKIFTGNFQHQVSVYREYYYQSQLSTLKLCLKPEAMFCYEDSHSKHPNKKPNVSLLMPAGTPITENSFLNEDDQVDSQKLHGFFKDSAVLLSRLHEEGFAHCDYKHTNFLEYDGQLYLSDFGAIKKTSESSVLIRENPLNAGGTFLSPEFALYLEQHHELDTVMNTESWRLDDYKVFEQMEKNCIESREKIDDQKRDVFAWACSCIYLLSSLSPELGLTPYSKTKSTETNFENVTTWIDSTRDVLQRLEETPLITAVIGGLDVNPATRFTMAQIMSTAFPEGVNQRH